MAEIYTTLNKFHMAAQIADLINAHNKLKRHYSAASVLHSPTVYFAETVGDLVVGCTGIQKEGLTLTRQLHTCVRPEFRRKGIAAKLKTLALANVETEYVFVTIREDNTPSLKLNEKFGFVFVKKEWARDHNVITLARRAKP